MNEFLAFGKNIIYREDGNARHTMFVNACNMDWEHGGV